MTGGATRCGRNSGDRMGGADAVMYTSIAAFTALNVVLLGSLMPALRQRGAPFVRTASQKAAALFEKGGLLADGSALLADGTRVRDLRMVDLGSGDGTLLRAAARAGYGRCIGYEINPTLVALSRLRGSETRWRSMWEADLSQTDVLLCYGMPPIMDRLGTKLHHALPAGAIVCSNAYKVPQLGCPIASPFIETSPWSPDASSHVFVYRAPGGPGVRVGAARSGGSPQE